MNAMLSPRIKRLGPVVEGPMGFKMPESIARAVDAVRKTLPKDKEFDYRRLNKAVGDADFELAEGERADISTITTDDPDRDGEVVIPEGLDLSQYSGVVTWCHDYGVMDMGRCLWIKPMQGALKAKTKYPTAPPNWQGDWFQDAILHLMQQTPPMCTGKSIGFQPMGYRQPSPAEIERRPDWEDQWLIDKGSLWEYCVCPVPANPYAEMEAVSKSLKGESADRVLAVLKALAPAKAPEVKPEPKTIQPFVRPETIAKAVQARALAALKGLPQRVQEAVLDRFRKETGQV